MYIMERVRVTISFKNHAILTVLRSLKNALKKRTTQVVSAGSLELFYVASQRYLSLATKNLAISNSNCWIYIFTNINAKQLIIT